MTSRLFRIQYISDLHLEMYQKVPFPLLLKPNARYLALAGDIGQPSCQSWRPFFDYVNTHWDRTFYVTGNHEYYSNRKDKWKYSAPTPFDVRHREIKNTLKEFKNVTLLDSDNPSFHIPSHNVTIIGNTLWSKIPKDMEEKVELSINDYNFIATDKDTPLTTNTINAFHEEHKRILERELDNWPSAKIIMLTHHMPSYKLINLLYKNDPMNCAFASDCEGLMRPNVNAWIYGHTHNVSKVMLGTTITAVNARGYPNEYCVGFSPEAYIEFPSNLGKN
jgi:predicted phosphodiesterase